jgi:hypothetical protein
MPIYRIHFAVEPHEPFPALEALPAVEADDPITAVERLLGNGQVAQNRLIRWARVVLTVHETGQPYHVLRVPLKVDDVTGATVPTAGRRDPVRPP